MLNKSPYITCYLIAIVIFTQSYTISGIFAFEMCMTFILTFRPRSNVIMPIKSPYMLFDDNHNFYHLYHHFQDIHCWNVHELDLQNGPRSNVNMPVESTYMTFHLSSKVTCTISIIFFEIIRYELQNIAVFNIWPCNRRSRSWGTTAPITSWMPNWFGYNLVKIAVPSQTILRGSPMSCTVAHFHPRKDICHPFFTYFN